MDPVVAIIGRPNVGKSTLFNRLVGKRLALVDDTPGLTRDRREGDARLGDLSFKLIDTAGYEDEAGATLAARMQQQTEAAISDADICLFVYDARAGVTPLDHHIVGQLRDKGMRTILIANKCEGRGAEPGLYEGFELGLGEPIALSAEHGEGMGDLYRELADHFSEVIGERGVATDDDPGEKAMRLSIVGRPNVGKSSLLNRLVGEERMLTGPEAGITRDAVGVDWNWDGHPVKLFDTAGLRKAARVKDKLEKLSVGDTLNAVRFSEVVILVMDAEQPFEKQDLQIVDLVAKEGRALIIVLNKIDLIKDVPRFRSDVSEKLGRLLPQIKGVPLVLISAETGKGVEKLLPAIQQVYRDWNAQTKTSDLNEWLRDMEQRHPPPAVNGKRIRLKYIAQIKNRPPTFALFVSRAKHLPESYQRYLINGLRDAFELQGTPIRLYLRTGKNPYASGN